MFNLQSSISNPPRLSVLEEQELERMEPADVLGIGKVADLISSATDTSTEIAQNIGQMA